MNTAITGQLVSVIEGHSLREVPPGTAVLASKLLERYGATVQAILFYGSSLRTGDETDSIVDLYVLVDDYYSAYGSWLQATLNRLLPPNVFYMQACTERGVVRAKYGVLSLEDFRRGTSFAWFHSYIWGRFAQPAAILYSKNQEVMAEIHAAQAQAVVTFINRVVPQMGQHFTARQLWVWGLSLSYGAELRAEKPQSLGRLYDCAPDYYETITHIVLSSLPYAVEARNTNTTVDYAALVPPWMQRRNRLAWILRTFQGKILSVLRLLKAAFTFEDGLEYVLWKIERHSGVKVEVSRRLQQHPLLAAAVLSWRLYRRKAFR
ncbi:MAG: hypothetical protein JRI89_03295 [Deltaproteobacteria bacterium]|nr:hypothetical protein [Deltaproteobacteria bacterium]